MRNELREHYGTTIAAPHKNTVGGDMTESEDDFTGMYDVLDALEAAIKAADPAKREALAETLDGFHESLPEEFHWAIGPQSPSLLYHLMMAIDSACREEGTKPRPVLRLLKPEGNA
jgi:hypothetical protein